MAAFGFRETKDGAAVGAFTVDVGFTVTELISTEAEEAEEGIVFVAAFLDIPRELSEEDHEDEGGGDEEVGEEENRRSQVIFDEEGGDGIGDHHPDVDPKEKLPQAVGSVSSVHKAIESICKFSHSNKGADFLVWDTARRSAKAFLINYSERNASTGSFLDATFAGIKPAMKVKNILMATKTKAAIQGRTALMLVMPERR